jgi:hypothetical protein
VNATSFCGLSLGGQYVACGQQFWFDEHGISPL